MRSVILVIGIALFSISVFENVFSEGEFIDMKAGLSVEAKAENPAQSNPLLQKGEGVVTRCNYRAGSEVCGTCYCLKAKRGSTILFNGRPLRGCARVDISRVGDLSDFVDRDVLYEGTADFDSTFICPQHFQLFAISPATEEIKKAE